MLLRSPRMFVSHWERNPSIRMSYQQTSRMPSMNWHSAMPPFGNLIPSVSISVPTARLSCGAAGDADLRDEIDLSTLVEDKLISAEHSIPVLLPLLVCQQAIAHLSPRKRVMALTGIPLGHEVLAFPEIGELEASLLIARVVFFRIERDDVLGTMVADVQ